MTALADRSDPGLKVGRARDLFDELRRRIEAYLSGDPYLIECRPEPATGDLIWAVHVREEIPPDWSAIFGDAIHNLHSALDHLACLLVRRGGGFVTDKTRFPFSRGESSFQRTLKDAMRGASVETFQQMRALRPFPGGNDLLALLHQLDIEDKHKRLLVVAAAYQGVGVSSRLVVPWRDEPVIVPPIFIRPAEETVFVEGTVLFRVPGDQIENFNETHLPPEFMFRVILCEADVEERELVPLLSRLAEEVDRVVSLFDLRERGEENRGAEF